jgi:uncharacterized repeat protein (TIGR01451 family)
MPSKKMPNKKYHTYMEIVNTHQLKSKSKKIFRQSLLAFSLLVFLAGSVFAQVTNTKTVDKVTALPGDPLNFGINVSYEGTELLQDLTVRDFVPDGTTFTSAGQGGTLQTFSSVPGISGLVTFGTDVERVYAFQGGSTAFWAYDPAGNTWSTLASAPGTTADGSALTSDGERYIYAFQGGSRAFYRYDAINDVWSDAAVADLPAAASVTGVGASLVFLDGFIYAFPGNSTNQFWRYSVNGNSWTQLGNAPNTVLVGGSLATDGADIYALRGGGNIFWKYSASAATPVWSSLSNIGQSVGAGSGMVYADDGFLYATTGAGQNRIYRYDIEGDSWAQGTTGISPNTGGDLATDGTRFWVTQGNTTVNFVERFYASADVTRANTPGNVVAGGALTYLASPGGLGTSQMGASPNVRKLGDSFTITLTLEATQAVTGVTPTALQITGGTATISGPSPASADLVANTPQTFSWTVTPDKVGEFFFSAGASSATVNFEMATSNSVLVSPDGQDQFVVWELGSNEPGNTGTSATNKYLYAFQGGTVNFWTFNTANQLWNNPLNPTNSPVITANGGSLTNDGQQYIYALQGGSRVFMQYNATTDTWDNAGITNLPDPGASVVGPGGALVYLNGYVYAYIGGGTNQFWRYDVAANSWIRMANTPANVDEGGALTTDGTNIFGFRVPGRKPSGATM